MPANLTPDYLAAERRFREAETPEERLAALQEMLATIPKHKGTEKMQGDIKRRIARLKQIGERRSGGAHKRPFWYVEREGAGQVVLLGPPNSGKSALLAALSNADPEVADYPFTTRVPLPGMVLFENVQIQLVDLPPLAPGRSPPWLKGLVKKADGVLVVFDLASDDLLEQAEQTIAELAISGLRLRPVDQGFAAETGPRRDTDEAPQEEAPAQDEEAADTAGAGDAAGGETAADFMAAPGTSSRRQPALIAGAKADDPDAEARLGLLREVLAGSQLGALPLLTVSANQGTGLAELRRALFGLLGKVRVYTKAPGKKADLSAPFVVARGSTVVDVAGQVHKDFARDLKYARVWGRKVFEGQTVQREYVVEDEDILELHV